MTWFERGKVKSGAIVLLTPLPLPEGTEVTVRIEASVPMDSSIGMDPKEFTSLPFFGMWADRDAMADSSEWIRKERDRWQSRAIR